MITTRDGTRIHQKEGIQTMTPEQIRQVIQGGQWVSITTELRPITNKSATGEIQPSTVHACLPIRPVTDLPVP
jgi:hypothetical protein